jgi:hypothetical protein
MKSAKPLFSGQNGRWRCLRPPVIQLTGDHRQERAATARLSTGHVAVHRNAANVRDAPKTVMGVP